MGKIRFLLFGLLAWCAPAHAVLVLCGDGTAEPLGSPNPCAQHGGRAYSGTPPPNCHYEPTWGVANPGIFCDSPPASSAPQTRPKCQLGSWGVADPIVAAVREADCEPDNDEHGAQDKHHHDDPPKPPPPPTPVHTRVAVKFHFHDRGRCVHDLTDGLRADEAAPRLPNNASPQEYCARLFPDGVEGVELATVEVGIELHYDRCEEQLTSGLAAADGLLDFPNGTTAEQACANLFPPQHSHDTETHTSTHTSTHGLGGTGEGEGCVVERSCGVYTVPNGHAVAGACGAVCSRMVCQDGHFVAGGSCGVTGSCDGGPNHGSQPMSWCPGDPLTL